MTHRTLRRAVVAALLPVTVLSLAACGGDDDDDAAADTTSATGGLTVVGIDGLKWEHDSYTATAGDVPITIDNESSLPHTLTVIAEDGTQIGGELETSGKGEEQTGTYTLAAGTYTIICTVPGHGSMKATLTVS